MPRIEEEEEEDKKIQLMDTLINPDKKGRAGII